PVVIAERLEVAHHVALQGGDPADNREKLVHLVDGTDLSQRFSDHRVLSLVTPAPSSGPVTFLVTKTRKNENTKPTDRSRPIGPIEATAGSMPHPLSCFRSFVFSWQKIRTPIPLR